MMISVSDSIFESSQKPKTADVGQLQDTLAF